MPHERLDTSNRLRWRNTNAPREGNPALSLPPTLSVEATTHYRRSRGAKTGATLNITDILQSGDGSATLAVLAKAYGISPGEAGTVLGQVAPALANRIERNTLSRGGVADILAEMANPAHGAVLDDPRHAATHAAIETGNGALDTILGTKDQSRSLAAQTAMSTGISQVIIQKLLPVLASMIMAALAKQTGGGLGDVLKRMPGMPSPDPRQFPGGNASRDQDRQQDEDQDNRQDDGQQNDPPPGRSSRGGPNQGGGRQTGDGGLGGLGDVLSKIPGMPGIPGVTQHSTPMPHPSAPADSGPFGGGSPLPIPGDRIPGVNAPSNGPSPTPYGNTPYGNLPPNLPDVIRDGGHTVDGNPLGPLIRDVLGGALGFQSKGIFSWIFRLLVLRWGWGFVSRLLSRVLMGRLV